MKNYKTDPIDGDDDTKPKGPIIAPPPPPIVEDEEI